MDIFLLRHGIAEERAGHRGSDEERALTAEGRREMRRVARAVHAMRLSFDIVFSSHLVRAQQTAEIVVESLRFKRRLRLSEHLAPDAPTERQTAWLNNLRPVPANVLLVGHEPNLSRLTSRLLTGDEQLIIHFKKAGLCKVVTRHPGLELASLEWFLTPSQMGRMRRS